MENKDVAMWTCLKALGFGVSKSEWDDKFWAFIDLWDGGKRIGAKGDTIYLAASALYDKVINLKAEEV